MEADLEGDSGWKMPMLKNSKRRTERKMQSQNFKEQIMTVNRYEALTMESDMFDYENKPKWVRNNNNNNNKDNKLEVKK
jgi:hypothetical protein